MKVINRSVKIEKGYIVMTKNYATKNLTQAAIRLAQEIDKTHIAWEWNTVGKVVLYELPNVFGVKSFMDIGVELSQYGQSYLAERGITCSTVFQEFLANRGHIEAEEN